MKLQYSLGTFLLLCVVVSIFVGLNLTRYKFIDDDYYYVDLDHKVMFQHWEVEIHVIPEEGSKMPSYRQQRLLSRLQGSDKQLRTVIADAAEQHRIDLGEMLWVKAGSQSATLLVCQKLTFYPKVNHACEPNRHSNSTAIAVHVSGTVRLYLEASFYSFT